VSCIEPYLLNTNEAGALLGACPETVRNLIETRQIPGLRLGGRWKVPKEALLTFLREKVSWPEES
jgi:excisionase family DNA binding protein